MQNLEIESDFSKSEKNIFPPVAVLIYWMYVKAQSDRSLHKHS